MGFRYYEIYHYLVHRLKRSRDLQIRGALDRALLTHSNRDYWREISKVRGKGRSNSSIVNGYSDSKDISKEFANNYNFVYVVTDMLAADGYNIGFQEYLKLHIQ